MKIFTDGSTTENHVGASMVAENGSKKIHINTQKPNTTCTVFQAELYGISMAIDSIQAKERNPPPTR